MLHLGIQIVPRDQLAQTTYQFLFLTNKALGRSHPFEDLPEKKLIYETQTTGNLNTEGALLFFEEYYFDLCRAM